MRRNNKQFVRNIIIVSVVGLVILMIALFATLQTFLGKQNHNIDIEEPVREEAMALIEVSETRMILVSEINENQVIGYDIKDRRVFNRKVSDTVRISDAYGKVLPITQIKKGDMIEVSYQEEKGEVVAISKSIQVQTYRRINGVTIDKVSQQINIGGTNYAYTDNTMVMSADGEEIEIGQLGPFDSVSIQMLHGTVWSIILEEMAASMNMVDLPTQNGQIEIDNSRLLPFKDITEPIKLTPGSHKIIIKMEGYVTISETLTVTSGEVYEMSLADAEIAYTTIQPRINADVIDYTIKVGDKAYKPGEAIKVPQGEYLIEISAEGYEKWSRKVKLEKDIYTLNANLTLIKDESEEEENQKVEEEANKEASRTIVLNTDPSGAKVYINGEYKGNTPYTTTLPHGSYSVLFEKEEYIVYGTNIVLNSTDDQSNFLYVLTPQGD